MNHVTRLPDGTYMDYGRHWRLFGKQGDGPARQYSGEAAEVMELLLKHQGAQSAASEGDAS